MSSVGGALPVTVSITTAKLLLDVNEISTKLTYTVIKKPHRVKSSIF